MKKNWIAIVVLVILVFWGTTDYMKKSDSSKNTPQGTTAVDTSVPEGITKGKRAPDFTLKTLDGKDVKLSDFQGKTILLNFWATWCPPCRLEMPHMEKFYKEYSSKNLVVLGVNVTTTESSEADVKSFIGDFGLTFPIVLDMKGEVTDKYQVTAFPTTYVISPKGIVSEKFQGAINYDIMKEAYTNANKGE